MNRLLSLAFVGVLSLNSLFVPKTDKVDLSEGASVSREVITDAETIRQMALEDGIDPDSVDQIVVEKLEYATPLMMPELDKELKGRTPDADTQIRAYTRVDNFQNVGDYYYPTEEKKDIIYGPGTVKTSYSTTASAKITSGITVESSLIKANLGAELGVSQTYTKEVSVDVPANKKVTITYAPLYQKWTYDIYYEYSNCMGLWYPQGTGSVLVPCGVYVRQYTTNR